MSAERVTESIGDLVSWKKNPRSIDDKGKDRLKEQMRKLGQHTPLLITHDDGFKVVLGGNMRLLIMHELIAEGYETFKKVWVSLVEFKENDGVWTVYLNGELQKMLDPETKKWKTVTYESKEAGMMSYALSHNDRAGFYVEDALVSDLRSIGGLDLGMYNVETAYSTGLETLIERYDMADVRARGPQKGEEVDRNRVKDAKEIYDNASIKQIVLYFPTAEYEDMLEFLATVMEEHGVESNTEAVIKLREYYENNRS